MRKMSTHFPKNILEKILKKDRLIIFLLSGVLLLVIAIPVNPSNEEKNKEADAQDYYYQRGDRTLESYTEYLEQHLEEILSLTENAGVVRTMITLEDSGEKVVEKDTESVSESMEESDGEGGMRNTQNHSVKEVSVYDSADSENENPYISKEKSPLVSGVVVIAQGGDNAVVVRNITEAVQALFDIDTHKIKVIKGN